MVIKTINCSFSEYRIYPAHGINMVRRDGQPLQFLNHKCTCMYLQKKKPGHLRWSLAWRRSVKKISAVAASRRVRRRRVVVQRAIVGASLENINKRRNETPELRKAQQEAALNEIKKRKQERKAKKAAAKK